MATHSATPAPAGGQSPKSVTVPEQLKTGFKAGTAARSGTKKIGAYAKHIAGTIVGIILLIWATMILIPHAKEEGAKVATEQSAAPTASAQWKQSAEDGTIPVGVWSESTMPPPGSKVFFDPGNGTVYQIRYRLYSGEWTIHPGVGYPPMNEFQFKALKGGLTRIPFTVKRP